MTNGLKDPPAESFLLDNKPSCVLIHSGGMDSTTLLYELLTLGRTPACLAVYYGQRHEKELGYAKVILARLNLTQFATTADLTGCRGLFKGSSQTSKDIEVPHGHYAEENMKKTVVPNRNMVMISLAAAWAVSLGVKEIFYAAHAGDHAIYPDCRTEFVEKLRETLLIANWDPVILQAPYLQMMKSDIVQRGVKMGVPYELTWSCYEGNEKHCGSCGTCVERREAFQLAGFPDPTTYAATPSIEAPE